MRPIATDVARVVVCLSVFVLVTTVSPAKTAEPINVLFRHRLGVGPMEPCMGSNTYGRHLANTIERDPCLMAMWAVAAVTVATCSSYFLRRIRVTGSAYRHAGSQDTDLSYRVPISTSCCTM